MANKEACYTRARAWGHKDSGRVIKALDYVFNTNWPAGTNIQLKFYEKLRGTPYGAKDKCMDNVVDCAELPRIGNYIFHGIDIGNYTDAQYKSKLGKVITENFADLPKCRPLDQPFYKTSALKKTGHTSIIFDTKRIIHSGASENGKKVDFSAITYGKKYWKKGMCVKRFLTDAQYNSVIVGGGNMKEGDENIMIKKGDKGQAVYDFQLACIRAGYTILQSGKAWKDMLTGKVNGADGSMGPYMVTVVKSIQAKHKLPQTGMVDAATYGRLVSEIKADTSALESALKTASAKIAAAKSALA